MPEWIGTALFGAFFGVLGFLGKWMADVLKQRWQQRHSQKQELLTLSHLLAESMSTFRSQNYQARRLRKLLRENHPDQSRELRGFDETFCSLHDLFTEEEKELQSLIRSTTMHSMYRINDEMRNWVKRNQSLLRPTGADEFLAELAHELRSLGDHLNQWFDKYETWIPGDERRSLVYLNDEKKHGIGFPKNITNALERAIQGQV